MKKERVTGTTQKAKATCSGKKGDVVVRNRWWEWEWKYIHSLGTVEIKRINMKCGGNEGSMLVNDLEWLIFCELCGMKRECASLISDFDCRLYFSLCCWFCSFGIQLYLIISGCDNWTWKWPHAPEEKSFGTGRIFHFKSEKW